MFHKYLWTVFFSILFINFHKHAQGMLEVSESRANRIAHKRPLDDDNLLNVNPVTFRFSLLERGNTLCGEGNYEDGINDLRAAYKLVLPTNVRFDTIGKILKYGVLGNVDDSIQGSDQVLNSFFSDIKSGVLQWDQFEELRSALYLLAFFEDPFMGAIRNKVEGKGLSEFEFRFLAVSLKSLLKVGGFLFLGPKLSILRLYNDYDHNPSNILGRVRKEPKMRSLLPSIAFGVFTFFSSNVRALDKMLDTELGLIGNQPFSTVTFVERNLEDLLKMVRKIATNVSFRREDLLSFATENQKEIDEVVNGELELQRRNLINIKLFVMKHQGLLCRLFLADEDAFENILSLRVRISSAQEGQ